MRSNRQELTPSDTPQPAARWSAEQHDAAFECWDRLDDLSTELGGAFFTAKACAEIAKHAALFSLRTVSAAEVVVLAEQIAAMSAETHAMRELKKRDIANVLRSGFAAIGIEVTR